MRLLSALAVAAPLSATLFVSPSPAQERSADGRPPPAEWLEPCRFAVGNGRDAWCGTYEVWENREAAEGRRIGLRVLVLPARSPTPDPDPVWFLHGGPGGAATEAAGGVAQMLTSVNETKDLVFVDQRGTGASSPIDCDGPATDAPLQEFFDPFLELDDVRRCLEKQEADVRLYTTPIAMDDYDEVREALGYETINLFGGSYGTRAGLVYLRRHPETVRSAALKGVAPTNMRNPLPFARALERGIEAIFTACETEPECAAAYPQLRGDWERAKARFEDGPVTAEVEDPRNGRRETVRIPRGVFADGLRHILYSIHDSRGLPRMIHEAADGDFARFAREEIRQSIGFGELLSMGMFMTVTCSEDLRFMTEEEIRRETAGTFLGDYRIRRQLAACEVWGRGEIDEGYTRPVRVENPVLLISGEYDTATPPEGGAWVAEHLPNSRHIIVPNESHGFVNAPCEFGVINRFLEAGTHEGLDASCLEETRRPKLIVEGS